jgi:hypothetical protein
MARIDVEITHPDRVLFPDDGITKGDIVDYYAEVAPVMLPHLKGRPLMVQRLPRGIDHPGFVQKDFDGNLPDWMSWAEVEKEGGTLVHALAERPEALVWLANQDCITLHTWLSRQGSLDNPDRLVFDLDPPGDDFARPLAPSPMSWTASGSRPTSRRPVRGGCTWWCRSTPTPTSPRSVASPARSRSRSRPTTPRTSPSRHARTSAVIGSTST